MTDPLDILFENLLEHLDENLPGTCWRSTSGRAAWRMLCWPP